MSSHPTDGYSRSVATGQSANRLTENFEHALALSNDPAFRAGALEVIASVAIARVELLEDLLRERRRDFYRGPVSCDNVVPLNKNAPATVTDRPGA